MFVRTVKNKQGRIYLLIVESYRESGRVKQRTLLNMGRLDVLQQTGQLDAIVKSLSRFCEKMNVLDLAKEVSVEQVYIFGVVHFVRELFKRTPLFEILEKIEDRHPKKNYSLKECVFALVVSRFVKPCSKLGLKERWLERLYPELVRQDISVQHFYRTLDTMADYHEDIQKWLIYPDQQVSLFDRPKLEMVFYDTTTLRFESVRVDKGNLKRFGYSKEFRTDCTQVVFGLLLDREGLPVGYRLFPGNTYEGKTVAVILKQLKKDYGISRLVFVADRGMINAKNLDEVVEAGYEFIMGMKLWAMKDDEINRILSIEKWDYISQDYHTKELKHPMGRLIVTWSRDRAQRDQQVRSDLINKLKQKLNKEDRPEKLISHRGYGKYIKVVKQGKVTIDEDAIAKESKRDGLFGILTNVKKEDLSSQEVVDRYKELWKIEDAFGEIKGTLSTRPMFHWTDKRIQGHVMICFLAYYLEAYVTQQLRKLKADFTAPRVFDALAQVKAVPVKVKQKTVWVRTKIKGITAEAYQHLRIKIPGEVMQIE